MKAAELGAIRFGAALRFPLARVHEYAIAHGMTPAIVEAGRNGIGAAR